MLVNLLYSNLSNLKILINITTVACKISEEPNLPERKGKVESGLSMICLEEKSMQGVQEVFIRSTRINKRQSRW